MKKTIFFKIPLCGIILLLLTLPVMTEAQTYPFALPNNITATLNVDTTSKEAFKNTLLGYNIEGFNTAVQKEFIRLVDPITIRFPHGVFANFYKWQTDGYQNDSYDNKAHEPTLDIFADRIKGHIDGIASLNKEKTNAGKKGFDMMWTYAINFDDGPSSVARAQKDIALGLEVKAIELGNEHFWPNQRALRTETPADFLREATAVSVALKTALPDIKLSIPLGWRRNQEDYNRSIIGNGTYFDAISIHKYLGADPDLPGESNTAYQSLLTAKLELEDDVHWIRNNFAPGKPVWLTEWGVSAGSDVHGAACLGMADTYLYMAENQSIYERSNWFSFNRVLNAMVVVGANREPVYPLKKRGYLSVYEVMRSVLKDATLLKSTVTSSTLLSTTKGSVNAVNARAVTKNGETTVVAVNLTDKDVVFDLKINNINYTGTFKHESLVFNNLGIVDPIDFYANPLNLIKQGSGTITLPALSISKISGIILDSSLKIIPGVLEAEDYKSGGQGVGYSDTDSVDALGAGNGVDGVDVGLFNGSKYIGDTQNGEWLNYDVNVTQAGDYDISFLYASNTINAMINAEIDSVILVNDFALTQTSNPTDFQTSLKKRVSLTAGVHVFRINFQNTGINLDKINFKLIPPPPAPVFVKPTRLMVIQSGENIEVEASSILSPSEIANIELFINDVSVRKITQFPYKWGFAGQMDALLENKAAGTYTLKLVLTTIDSKTSQSTTLVTSQMSPIQPFGATPHIVPGKIEFEDYDTGGQGLAYSDTTIGNDTSDYRVEKDVDIAVAGTGYVSTSIAGGEYTRYTINVTEAGIYHMDINFRTAASTTRPVAAALLKTNLTGATTLFSVSGNSSGIINTNGNYVNWSSPSFSLLEGTWVLEFQIPSGGAGPNYDYITLVKEGALSVDTFNVHKNETVIYPNPNSEGVFYLSKDSIWEVYSVTGVKITSGIGAVINISNYTKGYYIVKIGRSSKVIIYN